VAVTLPVVNGSSGTWGTILNAALTDVDDRLTAATGNVTSLTTRVTALETGGSKLTIATSSSRPTAAAGQIVLETDTGYIYYVVTIDGTPTRVPFPGSYVAKLKQTATQTFGNNSAGAITWTAEDFDRLSGWSTGTRYTATIGGNYEFSGAVSFVSSATGIRNATWYLNGVAQNSSASSVAAASGESTVVVARPAVFKLAAGDYVELYGRQTSGGSITTDNTTAFQSSMTVKYLGAN
jgi:hypothetical protein